MDRDEEEEDECMQKSVIREKYATSCMTFSAQVIKA